MSNAEILKSLPPRKSIIGTFEVSIDESDASISVGKIGNGLSIKLNEMESVQLLDFLGLWHNENDQVQ